ncbi:hypothetical protein AOQ84DRAFT_357456 [Glonium stellatum]|uniref:F-box domain-containing protein n=1 Tax=Glonium stellatum TaxID=574774 RepID=A0A8E2EP34_9PEZI|nr:hypothetical protein AOQ84DRAFT_357456 [Glonium stellatum]
MLGTLKPLMLDRVCNNRPIDLACRLLQLPVELLAIILVKLPQESLSNFALASWLCRQLARSRQLSRIVLDCSPRSRNLCKIFFQDMQAVVSSNEPANSYQRYTLGACVRTLTIAAVPEYLSLYEEFDFQS